MTSSILTNSFKYRIIKSLEEKFSDVNESIYFFYGKPLSWPEENEPSTITQSILQENISKSNILALKKIEDGDLILGVEKRIWTEGTQYDSYDDSVNLANSNYYVINSKNEVFKCLDNNQYFNITNGAIVTTESIDEPSADDLDVNDVYFGGNDGYAWQYLFTVSDAVDRKFNVGGYIPIDIFNPLTQSEIQNATPGTIYKIALDVENIGNGYYLDAVNSNNEIISLDYIPIFISGNGDEISTAKININLVNEEGSIILNSSEPLTGLPGAAYTIENPGSGYPIISGNRWIPIIVRQISSAFQTVTTTEDFEYAYGIAKVNANQQIENIRLINQGKGYSNGEAEVVCSSAVAYGVATPLVSGSFNGGAIVSVKVELPGKNFTVAKPIIISEREFGNPSLLDANLRCIVSRPLGHRSNPEIELSSSILIFNVRIAYEEFGGDFSVGNDFRTVGILENPLEQDQDGNNLGISNSFTLSAKTDLVCASENIDPNNFPADAPLIGTISGARGTIVDVVDNNIIRIIRDLETSNNVSFIPGESVISVLGTQEQIVSIIQPEYVPYSGEALFINNRTAISRSSDQIETINFILKI